MATTKDVRRIALSLAGTTEAPHFDRTAFKVARIYATVAADGLTANLKLTIDEQTVYVGAYPTAFHALDNAWGKQGWTSALLAELELAELSEVLELAWKNAQSTKKRAKSPKSR